MTDIYAAHIVYVWRVKIVFNLWRVGNPSHFQMKIYITGDYEEKEGLAVIQYRFSVAQSASVMCRDGNDDTI